METSAETIAQNEDLITEILLKLPVNNLLLFKSVSKRWLSLISSRRFSSLHTLRCPSPPPSALFLRNSLSHLTFVPRNSSPSSPLSLHFLRGLKLLQSCNGLLLFASPPQNGLKRTYYVANPTTKRLRALPSLEANANGRVSAVNLAFDPSKSSTYKIICVRPVTDRTHHYKIETYESEVAAWKPSGSEFVAPYDMVFDNGVYWNNGVHWISSNGNGIYFEVEKESIVTMPSLPIAYESGKKRSRYFGESGGHLHMIEMHGQRTTQFNVYEMEKDYSMWRVRCQVTLDNIVNMFPEVVRSYNGSDNSTYYAISVISVIEDEQQKEAPQLVLNIPGSVVSYDLKSKTFRKICELCDGGSRRNGSLQFRWLDAHLYRPTLACV